MGLDGLTSLAVLPELSLALCGAAAFPGISSSALPFPSVSFS